MYFKGDSPLLEVCDIIFSGTQLFRASCKLSTTENIFTVKCHGKKHIDCIYEHEISGTTMLCRASFVAL